MVIGNGDLGGCRARKKKDMQKYLCSKWDMLIVTNDTEHFADKDDPRAIIFN